MDTSGTRPNIVFIFTDDQRYDTIAALGFPGVKTPNLDQLTTEGTAFTQAHIQGGTVAAVCMPSRAVVHTGRTLFHIENDGQSIPEEHVLLGEWLQNHGYRTFGTGKWHNGTDSYARSFTDGAEIFFGGMDDHWNVPACDFDPTGVYDKQTKWIPNPKYSNSTTLRLGDHMQIGKHSTDLFTDAAVEWLSGYDSENPFFLYLSYMAPHDPRSMPEPFQQLYDPDNIELPANFRPEHPFDFGVRSIRDEELEAYPRTEQAVSRHIAEYYAMVTHLDAQVGALIAELKRQQMYDNTVIIFASDNGLALGQHGLLGKQNLYDHSLRVPLVFRGPGIAAGEQRHGYACLSDIFPTICDLIGLEPPNSVEGSSLTPLLQDPGAVVHETLFLAYGDLVRAIKDNRHKLIQYGAGGGWKYQLFDLLSDPWETDNLSEKPIYADVVKQLREKLTVWSHQSGDRTHPSGKRFWSTG